MSMYRVLVCDRCGKEQDDRGIDLWAGWRRGATIECSGIAGLYNGIPDLKWSGELCSPCADALDTAIRAAIEPFVMSK